MTAQGTTARRRDSLPWAAMTGAIATVTVFALAQGLTYPLLSFILERQETSPALIGTSAAMTMQAFGHQGLPISLGLLCAALALVLMAGRRRV